MNKKDNKQKTKDSKNKNPGKTVVAVTTKKKPKKILSLAKGVDIVEKADGSYAISGKNAKLLDGAIIERKERIYKFDDRLVPYYLGADSKDGNLNLRNALVALGKTPEMTSVFIAMKTSNMGYTDNGKDVFIKALYSIIKGFDEVGLMYVHEDDIKAIHDNNLKTFNEFWDAGKLDEDDELAGFSN